MVTEDILVKYLAGETEPHEVAMIEQWRKQSADNEKHFRQLETLWKSSEGLKSSNSVNVDAAWDKVKSRMNTKAKGKIVTLGTRWLAAASIILLLGVGVYLFNRNSDTKEDMVTLSVKGSTEKLRLSDGTSIVLQGGSLSYPKVFEGNKRRVKLESGKAFFEVAPDKEKPFEIESNNTLVTVVGTEFEVNSDGKSTQVQVREGKVRFSTPGGETMLTAGMGARYYQAEKRLEKMEVKSHNAFAYTTGKLVFENEPLAEVIADLEAYYPGTEFVFESQAIKNCKFNSSFQGESLDHVLEVIKATLQIEVERIPGSERIILRGKGCL